MAADNKSGNGGPGGIPPMGNGSGKVAEKAPVMQVLGQYIKDVSFENPHAPRSFQLLNEQPRVKIEVGVGYSKLSEQVYESMIKLEAISHAAKDETVLYNLEITYAGALRLENIPERALQPVLLVNAPTLLFPFLRRLAADLTREGGYPPLLLEPVDFQALYAQRAQSMKQKADA